MGLILCLIIFFFVWGIPMMKESKENEEHRQWCVRNGVDQYIHVDGTLSDSKTNRKITK